jgi:uncharacterized iron-regulated membrane protein
MSSEKRDKATWPRVRKFFNDIHLWLGLASGLIVIVVCFTGTVYVFNTEIREMSASHLYRVEAEAGAVALAPDTIVARVESALGGKVRMVRIPRDGSRTWQVAVQKEGEKPAPGRRGPGTMYAVNPYTGEVIGNISEYKNGVTEFMRDMFSLHRWLLLDRIEEPIFGELPNRTLGSYITGTATIFFTIGVLTGLIIWFPKKLKNWKQGLKIKWDSNWKRLNHDLHNTLAFYSLIFLFLMGVTGPQWSFPWYREGLQKTLGTWRAPDAPREKPPRSAFPPEGAQAGNIAFYLEAADEALPYEGDYAITLPPDSTAAVSVTKNRTGFLAPAAGDRLTLDQYSGAVIEKDVFRDKPLNERIAGSIKALHLGDVYGMFTKILYFFACLVATTLPITGTLIWVNKLKKKKKKARKEAVQVA